MSASISAINSLGLAGMQAAQTGLANVATNVSGASVEGFHRREVHPLMISASTNPLVQGGTVIIDSMMRSYSALVGMQYLTNHAKVKQSQTLNAAAQITDRMLVDESSGLTAVLNGYFTAAADLSADPASGTARTAFATTSVEIADRIRNLAGTIEETRRQALFQLEGVIDAVNEKAEALARVNLLIRGSSAYGKPLPSADLLDERDRLSGQLTDLVGASIETSDLGEATLRFDGVTLVQGGQSARLLARVDKGTGLPTGSFDVSLPRGDGNPNQVFTSVVQLRGGGIVQGEFGGLTQYAEGAETWLKKLDQIAMNLVRTGDPLRRSPPQQWYSEQIVSGRLQKLGASDTGFEGEQVFHDGVFRVKAFVNSYGAFVDPKITQFNRFQIPIEGDGYFLVDRDGETLYSRGLEFTLNKERRIATVEGDVLVTQDGDPAIEVPESAKFVVIGRDGTVTADDGNELGRIPLALFPRPSDLEPVSPELFRYSGADPVAAGSPGSDSRGFLGSAGSREFVQSLRPSLTLQSNVTSGTLVPWRPAALEDGPPDAANKGSADQGFAIALAGKRAGTSREWSEWVSSVSADMSRWRAEEAAYTSVDTSLREQREQVSGVDLDEEATNLLRFQQLYQANSAVIQAAMRMFDVMLSQTTR